MRPKDIGTRAETAVVKYLRDHGFPHAERRALAGALDKGDITGTPGIVWEVKGGEAAKTASDGQILKWLEETDREAENAGTLYGVLIVQRSRKATGSWWAVDSWPLKGQRGMRLHLLSDYVRSLRLDGFGEPL